MRVTLVRIYLHERAQLHTKIMRHLHDQESLKGVTLFRGVMGFGHSGEIHTTGLLDMSLDMPVIIEFFDEPDKVADVLTRLRPMLSVGHIVTLQAECL